MEKLRLLSTKVLKSELKSRNLSQGCRSKEDLVQRLHHALATETEQLGSADYFADCLSETFSAELSDSPVSELEEIPLENSGDELTVVNNEKGKIKETGSSSSTKVDEIKNMPENDTTVLFRDVEDSLETFTGESGKAILAWLKDFEDIATACSWNDIYKYLYARRLLRGAAKLAVESSTGLHNWKQLKDFLQSEFTAKPTTISVHRSLEKRTKQPDETYLEYLYTMKAMSNQGNVDEKSLLQYIVEGIQDNVSNKTVLYEAATFIDLKEKLKIYEAMQTQRKRSNETPFRRKENRERGAAGGSRCANCGAKSHSAKDCPNRSKGSRCFSCGNFGHMANVCPRKTQSAQPSISRQQVNVVEVPDFTVKVSFSDQTYKGLVDTGSSVTLIRKSIVDRARSTISGCEGPSIFLTGFGQNLKRTLGSIQSNLIINGYTYSLRCHVVPDDWITKDILIGADVLKDAKVVIEKGKLTLERMQEEDLGTQDADFMQKIDVVQLVQETSTDSFDEIQDSSYRNVVREVVNGYHPRKPEESCIKMRISMEPDTPVYVKPRRLAPKEQHAVSLQIKEWLEEGIISPSCSDFASPVVLAKKKDGRLRLCVDYRKLNRQIIKDRYPLPVMEDVLESLYQAKVFTTLDLRNGFFHVDIEESSRRYTSFLTSEGQYEFNKVPFGLCNSPSVFQRFINQVFQPLIRNNTILVYLDDVIIPTPDENSNLQALNRTLRVAEDHGLQINWSKCKFLRRSVEFLGHIVENSSIKPSKEKVSAVRNFPAPKNVKQVQSFLGLTGFFRKFIPKYSTIAKPLSDLVRKDLRFQFEAAQQEAFQLLKDALCTQPVLKLFDPKAETELHTDASKVGYGAVLLQKSAETRQFHPVFYLSFKTTDQESRYSSYELEVLAIVKSLRKLRCYLLGLKFTVFTDCKAFELTMRKRELNSRVARWALSLEEFDCQVRHKSGTAMRHVDALSRYPSVLSISDEILHQIRKAQDDDDFCRVAKKCLESRDYEDFLVRSGVLYKFLNGDYLLVVPKAMQTSIITRAHEHGHISAKKLEVILRQDYYIPNLAKKIGKTLSNCVPCILASRKRGKPECFFNPIEKIAQPLHTYHLDHLGPLTSTAKRYKYLFVVVDAFTKFCWIYPTKSTGSDEVVKKLNLQSEVFGNPYRIITDRGSAFTSSVFRSYCEDRGIAQVFITTGVPRGNGQVERMNQIIISVLAKMSVDNPDKWFRHTAQLQMTLNSTVSRSTSKTPFKLMFGVKMFNQDQQVLAGLVEKEIEEVFETERSDCRREATAQIAKVQAENRRYSLRKRKAAKEYRIGDLVAIRRTQFVTGAKIYPKFLGPYEISAVKGRDRYDVRKVGQHEGPLNTSSSADHMKSWSAVTMDESSSGTEDEQDGRM